MAKLLFITQKIDRNDDVLGVYHRWAEELGKKIDKLNIICLYKGECNLDENIGVFSLGKEEGISRIKYTYRFYKYVFSLRKEYDSVFVHMNPIYIVLSGLFWKLWGKKIFLWYNHPMGNLVAKIGILFSNKVFCTSDYAFPIKYKKTILMPVGIDTLVFKPFNNITKKSNRILSLGRISPIKKIEDLIETAKILYEQSVDFELLIVGSPASSADKIYLNNLKKIASELTIRNKIVFKNSVPNYKSPEIYNSASFFINLTPTGSFDKAILEAMACEVPVLVSNKTLLSIFPEQIKRVCFFRENDLQELSQKILAMLQLNIADVRDIGKKSRDLVTAGHSLNSLIQKLILEFNQK